MELFLDDPLIEMVAGVRQRIHQSQNHLLNPVLKPETWWEGITCFSMPRCMTATTNSSSSGAGVGAEQPPEGLDTIAELQKLDPIFEARGYSHEDLNGIFHGSWLKVVLSALPDS